MRPIALAIICLFAILAPVSADARMEHFATVSSANGDRLKDTAVWLNLPTGGYHVVEQRCYGRIKEGAYVSKREADADGDWPTRKG